MSVDYEYTSIKIDTPTARFRATHLGNGALTLFIGQPFGSAHTINLLPDEAQEFLVWLYQNLSDSR